MAGGTRKIVLSDARNIPFNKLVLSQSNVRRIKTGVSIEELAEDIARRTLLQSLNVRAIVDAEGAETGMFEVPAGGRRFRALELLVKQKRLAKTAQVPCVVRSRDCDISAEEDSLAENTQRQGLHPLDQFRSFKKLSDQGASEEEIAARFFVPVAVVKRRLRLTTVSEKLLDVYADDSMTLEQLMAFSVSSDHARQEQVWDSLSRSHNKEPFYIRRLLTEMTVRADDRRALFIGSDAYEAAGGTFMRDLFNADGGGYLGDPALVDRLVTEKLKDEAAKIAAEGWKWVSAALDFKYGHTNGLRRIAGEAIDMSDDERASYEALVAEFDALNEQYDSAEELPEEADSRLGELETLIASFEERPMRYPPEDIARAGVFISLDHEGRLDIERGFVRPEDERPKAPEASEQQAESVEIGTPVTRAVIVVGGEPTTAEPEDDGTLRPLSERLVAELTAHRTLALRDAVGQDFGSAFLAVLHVLALNAFYHGGSDRCLEVTVKTSTFTVHAEGLKDTTSAQALVQRHKVWKDRMPARSENLWDALVALDQTYREALFAHCASFPINAVQEMWNRSERRAAHVEQLAGVVHLDMVEAGWKPTVANYLGRVPKARILDAVREAKGDGAAQLLDHLKKAEMAAEAERLLADTGWLPEPLRVRDVTVEAADNGDDGALPDYLMEGDEPLPGTVGADADVVPAIAAE